MTVSDGNITAVCAPSAKTVAPKAGTIGATSTNAAACPGRTFTANPMRTLLFTSPGPPTAILLLDPRSSFLSPQGASSSLFSLGKDPEVKRSSPFDSLLHPVSDPSRDHLAPKDQDTSSSQPACLQFPTSMDPVMDTSQGCLQGPSTTLWLQQEQHVSLPQGSMVQQQQLPLDATQLWVLPSHQQGVQQQAALEATSAQLQLQALQQGNGVLMDLNGLSVSLQGSSLMPMQQQGINATINGVPVVLQVQNNAAGQQALQLQAANMGLQPMQQVYAAPPAAEQVYVGQAAEPTLLVGNNQVALQQAPAQVVLQPVQQQQAMTSSAPSASASTDPALQLQLQQLQEAVQQLSSQTAAVQRVLATQISQPQASQAPQPTMLIMERTVPAASSPTETQGMMSAQMTTSMANSPVSSFSGRDSMSSVSWHGLDALCSSSNTSSPSVGALQQQRSSRLAPAASAAAAGGCSHGTGMLCIVSAPEMPQHAVHSHHQQQPGSGQGAQCFSHCVSNPPGPFSQAQVLPGNGAPGMLSQRSWPAGADMVPVGCGSSAMPQHAAAGGAMGGHGPRMVAVMCNQGQQMPQHQPGRIPAAAADGAGAGPYMQRPFRGSKAFVHHNKGRQHGGPFVQGRGGSGPLGGPLAAGCVGRIVSGPAPVPAAVVPKPGPRFPGPWGDVPLEDGLKQLWSAEALARSRGGRLFNVQQLAWHPEGDPDPTPQDMYNFQKLKRMVQKLDAVHKTRVKLIKRIHAVADHGNCDLKEVYRQLRGLIGEMLHDSAMMIKSLEQSRVTGLVRLALMLQDALSMGPREDAGAAAAAAHGPAAGPGGVPTQPVVQAVACS